MAYSRSMQLLVEGLLTDPQLLSRVISDPRRVAAELGLDDEGRLALLASTAERLRLLLGRGAAAGCGSQPTCPVTCPVTCEKTSAGFLLVDERATLPITRSNPEEEEE